MDIKAYSNALAELTNTSPEKILSLLSRSQQLRVLFHGIKEKSSLIKILQEGISPLSPEHGRVSFWATGSRAFTNTQQLPLGPMATYDTPFFHYSGNGSGFMTLALTNQSALMHHGISINWKDNDYATISKVVPPEALSLFMIKTAREAPQKTPEQEMIELLLEHLMNGYKSKQIIQTPYPK